MANLTDASVQLFERSSDERFESIDALREHCQQLRNESRERWIAPDEFRAAVRPPALVLSLQGQPNGLTDWSFGQTCRLARVTKETINRLSADTAAQVLEETLPRGGKPIQVLTRNETVRAVHGASYTRLYNVDLLHMLKEFATDFEPPPVGVNGATGLYCGEQDLFAFLIDPTGWAEIGGEAFAPGFFLWNSEVGRRSLGVKTFWFQAVCQNHIVWDATEVAEFSRKHTANVHDGLTGIRDLIANLVETRDRRRDGFVTLMKKAMEQRLGEVPDEVVALLRTRGFTRSLANQAVELAVSNGRLTIFSVVDALTRLAGRLPNAGDRVAVDERAASLLSLAV